MPQNWFKSSFWERWNVYPLGRKGFSWSLPSWDIHGAIAETTKEQKLIYFPTGLNGWEKCWHIWSDCSEFAIKVQQ
jgi:hypothetical protein